MASPERSPRHAVLKQERSRATRQRLIDAAVELIREQGYEATTARDIATRAGVSEGTFFFHFPTKGDLLVALGLRTSARTAAAGVLHDDETVGEALERVADTIAESVQRIPRDLVVHTIVELYRRTGEWPEIRADSVDFQEIFRGIYAAARRRKELPPSIDVDEVATMLSGALLHAILLWAQGRREGRALASLLRNRVAVIHAGIVATSERTRGNG